VSFKKGLRDPSLIHKLTTKNPRASKEMFTIANKYTLAKGVALDIREQKKEKDSGHMDQPSSFKGHDKMRKADRFVNAVERLRCKKEYRPRTGEFEGFLDRICIFHPQGKHKTQNCNRLQGFTDEVLKMAKGADQEKKPKECKGDFPEAYKDVNYIYASPDSYESRWKEKLPAQEVMAVSATTPEYLKWSEVPITFDRIGHPDFVPKLGRYPLIVSSVIMDVKLNRVLIDGGSSLNIQFLKTFNHMGLL
jgi:exonuclease III